MQIVSRSAAETKKIAAECAAKILHTEPISDPLIIALEGDLGAGKTTFTQGFTAALGVKDKVKSPTFLLVKTYPLSAGSFRLLYHIDCYRVKDWKELEPLEIRRILKEPGAIVLIEWPGRIRKILPKKTVKIRLDHVDKNKRTLSVTGL